MTVALPPALTQLVERLLHTGRDADEGEVVREALRVLEHQEFDESPALEAAILEGVRSSHVPFDASALERIRQNACLQASALNLHCQKSEAGHDPAIPLVALLRPMNVIGR